MYIAVVDIFKSKHETTNSYTHVYVIYSQLHRTWLQTTDAWQSKRIMIVKLKHN